MGGVGLKVYLWNSGIVGGVGLKVYLWNSGIVGGGVVGAGVVLTQLGGFQVIFVNSPKNMK